MRDMLDIYITNHKNATLAHIRYQERFPDRLAPGRKLFTKLYRNLGEFGSFDRPKRRINTVVTEELEEYVLAFFEAYPTSSIRQAAQILNSSRKSIEKILKKHKFSPYKPTRLHVLHPGDEARRTEYCAWLTEQAVNNENVISDIIWTDESNFSNRGMSNRHNTHYWSRVNPLIVREGQDQVRFSINCWCALKANGILAVHFYEGNLNGARYRRILEDVLLNSIETIPLVTRMNLMYQHDGAPAHNSQTVVDFLNATFPGKWIGTHGPISWPARSPDLTPLDFFLWGYIKNKLYEERYASVETMVEKIRELLQNIHHNVIKKGS